MSLEMYLRLKETPPNVYRLRAEGFMIVGSMDPETLLLLLAAEE